MIWNCFHTCKSEIDTTIFNAFCINYCTTYCRKQFHFCIKRKINGKCSTSVFQNLHNRSIERYCIIRIIDVCSISNVHCSLLMAVVTLTMLIKIVRRFQSVWFFTDVADSLSVTCCRTSFMMMTHNASLSAYKFIYWQCFNLQLQSFWQNQIYTYSNSRIVSSYNKTFCCYSAYINKSIIHINIANSRIATNRQARIRKKDFTNITSTYITGAGSLTINGITCCMFYYTSCNIQRATTIKDSRIIILCRRCYFTSRHCNNAINKNSIITTSCIRNQSIAFFAGICNGQRRT